MLTDGLMFIVRHVARLQRYVVSQVALTLGSFLQVFYGIFYGSYLSCHVLLFLQIDRAIEQLRSDLYLTDFAE